MLLITIASGPNRGRAVRLAKDSRHVLGRKAPPLDLEDPKVSRKHAELIAFPDGQVIVKDLGSRNGTYVDKKKITGPTRLRDGAVIQLGQTVCVFSRVADAVAAMPPAPPSPTPEALEAQAQTRRMLEELRDGLRQIQASPAPPSAAQLELVQGSILRRLDEVSQKLAQVSKLAEHPASPGVVEALAPKLDAILQAQSRPLSATESLAVQLSELHRKLDAMAAEAGPRYDDVPLRSRLEEVTEALSRLAESTSESGEEQTPAWLGGLERSIAAAQASAVQAVEQRMEALAAAPAPGPALAALEQKVQALAEALQASHRSEGTGQGVSSKLDVILHAIQSLAPAGEADTRVVSAKLDDLLTLVAAQAISTDPTAPSSSASPAVYGSDVDARLDAILQGIQALGEAVIDRPAAVEPREAPPLPSQAEALLVQVAERMDVLAAHVSAGPSPDELVAEVDRHWTRLEERLMQHLRGTSEAAESQMRKAIGDLTAAVRTMAERSDRVVLEQVLGELRGHNTHAMQEMLEELNDRVRRLPGGAGHSVETQAVAHAVRQAFQQVGEQLQALPERLNNNLVLGDILDLLRSIERHQRHQSQWLASMDEKLDNLGASETAVFAPITDVPMEAEPEPDTRSASSLTSEF